MIRATGLFLVAGIAVLGVCSLMRVHAGALQEAERPEYFTTKVKPLLDANCGRCHEGLNRRGGLNMETRESLLKGGHHGPALVPGDPSASLMLKLINHAGPADDPMNMPPNKPKLSEGDIATIAEWIKAGAVMPAPSLK